MENLSETVSLILAGALAILFFVLYVMSITWAARDAEARGKSGCLVAILVWLTWPWGLLLWIVFRPAAPASAIQSRDDKPL